MNSDPKNQYGKNIGLDLCMTSISTYGSHRLSWKITFENPEFTTLKWYFWDSLGVMGSNSQLS